MIIHSGVNNSESTTKKVIKIISKLSNNVLVFRLAVNLLCFYFKFKYPHYSSTSV